MIFVLSNLDHLFPLSSKGTPPAFFELSRTYSLDLLCLSDGDFILEHHKSINVNTANGFAQGLKRKNPREHQRRTTILSRDDQIPVETVARSKKGQPSRTIQDKKCAYQRRTYSELPTVPLKALPVPSEMQQLESCILVL